MVLIIITIDSTYNLNNDIKYPNRIFFLKGAEFWKLKTRYNKSDSLRLKGVVMFNNSLKKTKNFPFFVRKIKNKLFSSHLFVILQRNKLQPFLNPISSES